MIANVISVATENKKVPLASLLAERYFFVFGYSARARVVSGFATYAATRKFHHIGRQPALRMKAEGLYPKWHGGATYAATRKLYHIGRQPALRMKSEGLYPKWHGGATYVATRKLYPKWYALTSDGGIDEISCSFIWGVL